MYQPVKIGFGGYLAGFFASIAPTTKYLSEYVKRPLNQAMVWAPGRLVDMAEDMLAAWQADNSRGQPTKPYTLPILLIGMAKDAAMTPADFGHPLADPEYIVLDNDPKDRLFKLRAFPSDIRTQIVIAAHEEPTARSLASQLLLWCEAFPNRRFKATYRFAGQNIDWPVQVGLPEMPASLVPTDHKNLTLLTVDLTLHATVPLYQAPRPGEPNDGQGDPGDPDDPAGYPFVVQINQNDDTVITESSP